MFIERVQVGPFAALAAGPGDGELSLCLHGFPDHAPTFEALAVALASSGRRVVVPWMRGYAPSILSGPYDVGQLADDVLGLANALSPDRPIALVGHDWGAIAAYAVCDRAPSRVRRAVALAIPHFDAFRRNLARHPRQLLRSWYIAFFQLPAFPERALVLRDLALVDRLWRDWSPGFRAAPEYMAELKRCLAASLPAPIGYYRAMARSIRQPRRERPLEVPFLHLHGEDDGCIGPELSDGEERFFAAQFRRAVMPGVGHFLHLEEPEAVNARILEWLSVT